MWNHQQASDYLIQGRKKYTRPLYDRGLYVWQDNKWDPNSDIYVGYPQAWSNHGNPLKLVTYHKDGSTTIECQYPRAYSYRFSIWRYSGIEVLQRNFRFYLKERNPTISAPKIQGCRTCSQSGLVDGWGYSKSCYNAVPIENYWVCEEHKYTSQSRWHQTPCMHGSLNAHEVKKFHTCPTCAGVKKHDYGSKAQLISWDGTPIRTRDGKVVKAAASELERMMADYVEPIG